MKKLLALIFITTGLLSTQVNAGWRNVIIYVETHANDHVHHYSIEARRSNAQTYRHQSFRANHAPHGPHWHNQIKHSFSAKGTNTLRVRARTTSHSGVMKNASRKFYHKAGERDLVLTVYQGRNGQVAIRRLHYLNRTHHRPPNFRPSGFEWMSWDGPFPPTFVN